MVCRLRGPSQEVIYFLFCRNIYFCRFYVIVTIVKVTTVNVVCWGSPCSNLFKLCSSVEIYISADLQNYLFKLILCHCHQKGDNCELNGIFISWVFFEVVISFWARISFFLEASTFGTLFDVLNSFSIKMIFYPIKTISFVNV